MIGVLYPTYSALGDLESALRLARRGVALRPNSPLSHFGLGSSLVRLGRYDEAIVALREQQRLAPYDGVRVQGLAILGLSLFVTGQIEAAEEALDRALSLRPNFDVALTWKAIAASERGNEHAAQSAIRRLRETEPNVTFERIARSVQQQPHVRFADAVAILRRLWDATHSEPKAE